MPIAPRVAEYLARRGAHYDVVAHPRSHSSIETAELAHVHGGRLLKSVVLEDDDGMVIAVLPATLSVHIGRLSKELDRRLRLATEDELQRVFPDCRLGAIPPLGAAYGLRTILDDSVEVQPEVWFEGGDHEHLIHMTGEHFVAVLGPADRCHFGTHVRRTHR